jgi:hypothetical protein
MPNTGCCEAFRRLRQGPAYCTVNCIDPELCSKRHMELGGGGGVKRKLPYPAGIHPSPHIPTHICNSSTSSGSKVRGSMPALYAGYLSHTAHSVLTVSWIKTQWSAYIPPDLTFKKSTFSRYNIFMCFL